MTIPVLSHLDDPRTLGVDKMCGSFLGQRNQITSPWYERNHRNGDGDVGRSSCREDTFFEGAIRDGRRMSKRRDRRIIFCGPSISPARCQESGTPPIPG